MVADISSAKSECSIFIPHLCRLYVDLTVLYHLVTVVIATDYTHSLCRLRLLHDLQFGQ